MISWCVTYPSCSLLQVASEGVGHGAKLQGFVDIGRLPPFTEHERRCGNILGQGAQGNHPNVLDSFATEHIARSCAPGNSQGVFDWFADVHEKVQTLC